MKIILQDRYKQLTEGKIQKDLFLREAKQLYPQHILNHFNIDETIGVLKKRRIIHDILNENIECECPDKEFKKGFAKFLNEAQDEYSDKDVKVDMKKTSKGVDEMKNKSVDLKDETISNNIPNQAFIVGMYAERGDEKNKDKTYEQLVDIVVKNLTKDQLYYVKDGQFGIKGFGYKEGNSSKSDKMEKVKFDNNSTDLKSNTKDTLSEKEAKTNMPKKVDTMTTNPKSLRGVKKMPMPGKEKIIKLQENQSLSELFDEPTTPKNFEDLDSAKKWAQEFSSKEGVSVHINKTRGGGYIVEDWYDSDNTIASYGNGEQLNESEFLSYSPLSKSNFEGPGLIVVGSTVEDNINIENMLVGYDYYGIWNTREGYFFFPEEESLLDELEQRLQNEFNKLNINARFEYQLSENKNPILTPTEKIESLAMNKLFMRELEADDLTKEEAIEFLTHSYNEDDIDEFYKEVYGSYEKNELEEIHNVLDKVKIHPDLTTDPLNKQGENGIITHLEKEYAVIKFNSGESGRYQYGTFSKTDELELNKETNKNTNKSINENMDPLKTFKKFLLTENIITEAKKIPVSKKISEIEKNAATVALESKINAIDEEITRRNNQIKMVGENEDLSELVDKNRMKELQKEIKLLEKQKDKYVKLYEKQTGKKKQEVVTDSEADAAEEAPIEEATKDDVDNQKKLNNELANTQKAADELNKASKESGLLEEKQPTEEELTAMQAELESSIDMVSNFEEAVEMYLHNHPEHKEYEITLRQLAEPMF